MSAPGYTSGYTEFNDEVADQIRTAHHLRFLQTPSGRRFYMVGTVENDDAEMEEIKALRVAASTDWQNAKVSIDMDTHFDGDGLRVFGRVVDWQPEDYEAGGAGAAIGLRLLCEYESDNFGMLKGRS